MTFGEAVELVGIMLGLTIFPGLPILAALLWLAWWLFAKRMLGRRR